MRLTVVTWNIHKCIGGRDRLYRPERVIDLMRIIHPDFLLLQEVDEGADRSLRHRQVDLIGNLVGLRHRAYFPTHRLRRSGHYGNAILSRWPLSHVEGLDLTIGARKKRGAVVARAHVRHGEHSRTVLLCNLHLGLAGSERHEQLRRFLAHEPLQRVHHGTPIVFGGDFNDLWGTLGPRHMEPLGFRRAGAMLNTFPAFLPIRPLDALYLRGPISVIACGPSAHPLARVASDHLPVVADLVVRS